LIFTTLFSANTSAAFKVGDKLGNVLNTDIKTYINGERIPCYNIDNKSVVLIADLRNYGFDVEFDESTRTSTVKRNIEKKFTPIQGIANNTAKPGTIAFSYLYTDIVAYVNGRLVESYNVQGNLAIFFSALGDYGTFQWSGNARTSKLTLVDGNIDTSKLGDKPAPKVASVKLSDLTPSGTEGAAFIRSDKERDNTDTYHKDVLHTRVSNAIGGAADKSFADYILNNQYARIEGDFWFPYAEKDRNVEAFLKIWGNDKLLYTSPRLTKGIAPIHFKVDLKGINEIRIGIEIEGSTYGGGGSNSINIMLSEIVLYK
jgi:hypothetical protein